MSTDEGQATQVSDEEYEEEVVEEEEEEVEEEVVGAYQILFAIVSVHDGKRSLLPCSIIILMKFFFSPSFFFLVM